MSAEVSQVSPRWKSRKVGLILVLIKLIIWHGYICICNPGIIGVNCSTSNECAGEPCKNNGTCNNITNGYICTCKSGFTGHNCTQPTTVEFSGTAQWNLSSSARDIEFSFRTTLKAGLILQIAASNVNLFLSLSDQGLNLLNDSAIHLLAISGTFSNGEWHNLSVSMSESVINITIGNKLNNHPITISTITSYYLGSVQSSSEKIKTNVPAYVGCMKDLKIGGKSMVPNLNGSLVGGIVGSCTWKNHCSSLPCNNGGNCTDLWNDFKCSCSKGFSGKECSYITCAGNPCPLNTSCFDLKSGNSTCVSPYTFNRTTSNLVFQNIITSSYSSVQFSIRTPSETGLILASGSNSTHFTAIGLNGGKVVITYQYWNMGASRQIHGVAKINDGIWHNINITSATGTSIVIDSKTDVENSSSVLNEHFKTSIDKDGITVGSNAKPYLASLFTVSYFKGCFEKLLLGGELLKHNSSMGVDVGCQSYNVCTSHPCIRGTCVDTFNSYRCDCPEFYSGVSCNLTHNVTCRFKPNLCGVSTCQNLQTPVEPGYSQSGKDFFRCSCATGYTGYLCETVVDNCVPTPCANGVCTSSVGSYICNCTAGFSGKNCTVNDNECASNPCQNGGKCQDKVNGFVCECGSGYKGDRCQTSSTNVGMWIGIGIAIFVVILLIIFIIARHCMGSSGLSGSYSPTGQEKGQVQMTSMPPIPPKERLI